MKPIEAREQSKRIRVLNRELLSDCWARLESVNFDYLRSNGVWQNQTREIYHRGHGAAVLLYNFKARSIVLTRQFRFPAWELGLDGFLLEVPAGIIEADNPEATVQAEAQQETGYVIDKPQYLFRAFATPGSVTELLYYYVAEYSASSRDGNGGGIADEGEDIEVLEVPINEAANWVLDGQIIDAKTIVLIQYAQLRIFT